MQAGDGNLAKLKEIYLNALEREPGTVSSYLTEACEGDAELRRRVENMLAQQGATVTGVPTGILPDLLVKNLPAFAGNDLLAKRFRIVSFLGRGGMGEVYLAEDEELGGRVALKTVRHHLLESAHGTSRFRRGGAACASGNAPQYLPGL